MLDIVLVLAVFGTLLVVVALSQPLAERLGLAPVVLLAVIGGAMGAASGFLLQSSLSSHFGDVVRLFADLPLISEAALPGEPSRAAGPLFGAAALTELRKRTGEMSLNGHHR